MESIAKIDYPINQNPKYLNSYSAEYWIKIAKKIVSPYLNISERNSLKESDVYIRYQCGKLSHILIETSFMTSTGITISIGVDEIKLFKHKVGMIFRIPLQTIKYIRSLH